MAHEVAVIAPDDILMAQFENLRQETIVDFTLRKGLMDDSIAVARELIAQGAKVLVSRDATSASLRSAFSTPVVDIPVAMQDVITLIEEARKHSRRIAVIGFGQTVRAARAVAPIFAGQVHIEQLKSVAEAPEALARLKGMGFTVVVGSATSLAQAESLGMRAFRLRTPDPVLRAALIEAGNLTEVMRRENELRLRQQASIDAAREGVIVLDGQGRCLHSNQWVQMDPDLEAKLFLQDGDLRQLRAGDILEAVRQGAIWQGTIQSKESGREYICRAHPVPGEGKNLGAVMLLEPCHRQEQERRRDTFQRGLVAQHHFEDIVHDGPAMRELITRAQRYAGVDATVLILGECGTGKELIAQSLHNASRRRHGPFLAVNCSALPENLLESELFGYVDGAFTGARKGGKKGLLELAESGTLFLDEIGEMALPMQVKLLRVLEERQFMRVGGEQVLPANVRVICATNRDLPQMIAKGKFRQDLYFRINVLHLILPPLRERGSCLDALVRYYAREICSRMDCPAPVLQPDAWEVLRRYLFPGNVRELKSILERLMVDYQGQAVDAEAVQANLEQAPAGTTPAPAGSIAPVIPTGKVLRHEEMRLIRQVLAECQGNRMEAARRLGISTTTLWRRLRQ